ALGSGHRPRTRVSPHHLRRLPEGTQKGAAHAVAIRETGLAGDDLDWVTALLHHQPRGLDTQVLNRLGRRLAGLGVERASERAWAKARRVGELLDCQPFVEIALRIIQCGLNAIGFWPQLQQRQNLRLAAGTPVIDHELLSDRPSYARPEVLFDHGER